MFLHLYGASHMVTGLTTWSLCKGLGRLLFRHNQIISGGHVSSAFGMVKHCNPEERYMPFMFFNISQRDVASKRFYRECRFVLDARVL